MSEKESIKFYVNGKECIVGTDHLGDTRLVDYLRGPLYLTGTKFMCRSGACGICTVTVQKYDPVLKKNVTMALNSCLLPLYSCEGIRVTTTEGLGDRQKGYHKIQQRLADYYGTQCGYCTPGAVMVMNSLLESNAMPTKQEVEKAYEGHYCRCTGYRPILEGMETFAISGVKDIEDMDEWVICDESECSSESKMLCRRNNFPVRTQLKDSTWWRPTTLQDLFKIMKDLGNSRVKYVVGNSSSGIFKDRTSYDYFIDMKEISELYEYQTYNPLTIGANISYNHLIRIFNQQKTRGNQYTYCGALSDHIQKIGNNTVRNIACWAGNLIEKRNYPEFQSDMFILLEAVGAKITLVNYNNQETTISPKDILTVDMKGKIIKNMILPALEANTQFRSYKVAQRRLNSHAYVNAAFLFEVNSSNDQEVLSQPNIVFGGIAPNFSHATNTEKYLSGKTLAKASTLKEALETLQQEINPNFDPVLSSPNYRKTLALTLLYKAILDINQNQIGKRFKSGYEPIFRPLSFGKQDYGTTKSQWPLSEPLPKLESIAQCSGELRYSTDLPRPVGTLYAAFIVSNQGPAYLSRLDASEALKMDGVVKFITAKDIPGQNNFIPLPEPFLEEPEELFASGQVKCAGQLLGLILAETYPQARAAAASVRVEYSNIRTPVLTIKDAIKAGRVKEYSMLKIKEGDPDGTLKKATNKLKGEFCVGSQFAFSTETQVTLSIPNAEGVDIYSSSQWVTGVQRSAAVVLNIEKSK